MAQFENKLVVKAFLFTRSETVFRQLYRKHTLPIYRLALLSLNKDMRAAEEVVQETWIRAIEKLQDFKWQSSFKTWLSGILINCWREYKRKRFPLAEMDEEVGLALVSPNPEVRVDLQKALMLLPSGYREVLLLHDLEGYKHEEIGVILNISEGTSKSQLFHARRAIRKLLN